MSSLNNSLKTVAISDFISEKSFAADMAERVVPYLAEREREGYFVSIDGKQIHYISRIADEPRAVVVISHGYTESCRKYDELSYYLLREGYSVYLVDHRGHGQSYRKVSDLTLTHIDRFEEYVDDFEVFVNMISREACGLPLCLIAHSMGGAVGAMYMERHPGTFARAVLSSPMIAPSTGSVPAPVALAITKVMKAVGKGADRSFTAGEYPGEEKFEDACSSGEARFNYYERKRRTTDYLQNFSMTYSWIEEAIGVTKKILKNGAPESIKTKTCVFAAGNDTMVLRKPQEKLAARLSGGQICEFPGVKHELFMADDDTVRDYAGKILGFFGEVRAE